ncbi:MAG: ARMT1-like domain-containing protein, partial [Desulfatiglandales bacterium]
MLLKPDCIPCVLNMSISVLRRLPLDEDTVKKLYTEILEIPSLQGRSWNTTSVHVIEEVMKKIHRTLNDRDPFASEKDRQNRVVEALYPQLKSWVESSTNPLYTAAKLAILGNAIDFMVPQNTLDIEKSIKEKLDFPVDQKEFEKFECHLRRSKRVLYFADNCGEIVFDRLFMETVKKLLDIQFVLVVKSVPAMNDVTWKEAHDVGMDGLATVIENGIQGPVPGTILARCSDTVKEWMGKADLFISKGGGNFDTLDEEKEAFP